MMGANDFNSNDMKHILNLLMAKIEGYENKLDNIETKVSDLSVIKHQIETFTKQVTEMQSDIRSLRTDYESLKSTGYKIEDILEWKRKIDQTISVVDLETMKSKSISQELVITKLTERLESIKEELKKEMNFKNLVTSSLTSGIIVFSFQLIMHFIKIS